MAEIIDLVNALSGLITAIAPAGVVTLIALIAKYVRARKSRKERTKNSPLLSALLIGVCAGLTALGLGLTKSLNMVRPGSITGYLLLTIVGIFALAATYRGFREARATRQTPDTQGHETGDIRYKSLIGLLSGLLAWAFALIVTGPIWLP